MIVYYAIQSGGRFYCQQEALNPYLMQADYPLFDSAEECIAYWAKEGITVE